jgi:hypothetical protein
MTTGQYFGDKYKPPQIVHEFLDMFEFSIIGAEVRIPITPIAITALLQFKNHQPIYT